MLARDRLASLSLFLPGVIPPTEFKVFSAGWNDTDKGRFLFDAGAAKAVMDSYAKHGVDVMIDLEHLSLDDQSPNYDPDARGSTKLELRADGSLWAVGVAWTPDGAERLQAKRQRYVSPTFLYDRKSLRVTRVWNIALTAQPATHHSEPLVAASQGGTSMEEMSAIAEALGLSPDAPIEDIIATFTAKAKALQDAANGGQSTDDGPPDSAADVAPPAVAAAEGPPPAAADDKKPEDKKAAMAASARLIRLSGKETLSEVVDEVETWRRSHLELETERVKLSQERAVLESAERRKLCTELVTLGAEFPASVWADDKSRAIKPRWAKMSIGDLREHVADQRTARGTAGAKTPKAPKGADETPGALSARELQICKESGCKPEDYAALKMRRGAAIAGGN